MNGVKPGEPVTVTLPPGETKRVQIRATATKNATVGNQFALADVTLTDLATGQPLRIRHRVVLPPVAPGMQVAGWSLRQEQPGRAECVDDGEQVRCSPGLAIAPETGGAFSRVLSVPEAGPVSATVTLRPRAGEALNRLLAQPGRVSATGEAPSSTTRLGCGRRRRRPRDDVARAGGQCRDNRADPQGG